MKWYQDSIEKWEATIRVLSMPNIARHGDFLEADGEHGRERVKFFGKCGFCEYFDMHCAQCPLNNATCTSHKDLKMPTWKFVLAVEQRDWAAARRHAENVLAGIRAINPHDMVKK